MATQNDFRRMALALAGAAEGEHMDHPDFRAHGKIFATLHPDGARGMVKVTPAQQAEFIRVDPDTFAPASGAWGRQGCTMVRLASVDDETLGEALTLAWQHSRQSLTTGRKPSRSRKSQVSSRKTRVTRRKP